MRHKKDRGRRNKADNALQRHAKSCVGKTRHRSQESATATMIHMKSRTRGQDLEVYRCRQCLGFHLGHKNPKVMAVLDRLKEDWRYE